MKIFYHIDRLNRLENQTTININNDFEQQRFFPIQDVFTKNDLESLTNELYPEGLSEHGKKYLLDEKIVINGPNGPQPVVPHIPIIELVFELVRRLEFSSMPSRLQSIFAWESKEQAENFNQKYCSNKGYLYSLQSNSFIKKDMNLLFLGGSTIGSLMYARKYWKSECSKNPNWEVLLQPPVTILHKIN